MVDYENMFIINITYVSTRKHLEMTVEFQ